MKLYDGSLTFNMNLPEGGQPSWGTELGQGDGYKFNSCYEEILPGMVYNAVKDIENVWCPLGKGGSRQNDYEYVIASLFKKVYINDTLINSGQFMLLIVKQIYSASGTHIGRRSLKYNPKIKYNDVEINNDFFEKARDQLGLAEEAAWFVDEIVIVNQDELHLISYICDKDNPIEFESPDDKAVFVDELIRSRQPTADIYGGFQDWLTTKNNPHFTGREKYAGYAYCLKRLVGLMFERGYVASKDLNSLDVSQYEAIRDEYSKHQDIINFDKTKNQSQAGIAALKKYILYIKFINKLQENPIRGFNKIYYGAPGCGKSFFVENDLLKKELKISEENVVRTTFFPDYSNTDFVGQVLPKVYPNGEVTYEFNPGPFTIALLKALKNKNEPIALVVEEINRGSAASIFGDIFQLLDRNDTGESVFKITNINIQDYVKNKMGIEMDSIYIPSNLFIIATMNTSDQNVFTLDTAFKRRWEFEKIKNEFKNNDYDLELKKMFVPGMNDITWEDLVKAINSYIVKNADQFTNEDKQIGVYFVDKKDLAEKSEDIIDENKIKNFSYKLFEYLWDDVAKFSEKHKWFKDLKTLDQLLETYHDSGMNKKGESVFSDSIIETINDNKTRRLSKV